MSSPRDTRPEEPSAYVFRWGVYSWVCVGLGAAFVLMWSLQSDWVVPGVIIGVAIALLGGVLFALVPRKALDHRPRPMTRRARIAAAAKKRAEEPGKP